MKELLMQTTITELTSQRISIQVNHVWENELEMTARLKDECFSFIIGWVIPRLKGLDVLIMAENKNSVLEVFQDEEGKVFAETHLPERITREFGDELVCELEKIIRVLLDVVH